jgi:predicted  nucleic acid-binding Zn-ribbon protein
VKTQVLDSIEQISKERVSTEGNWSLTGSPNQNASESLGLASRTKPLTTDERLLDDTTVDRLVRVLDSYNADVRSWIQKDESDSNRGRWPSLMTFSLFGLGIAVTAATNYWNYGRQFADHEFVLFNLSGAMVFLLAGISLFYDRSVREIGGDRIRKESGRRIETMSDHVRSLSQLYQKWISDWKSQKQQLERLESSVREFDAQSVAAQIKASQWTSEAEEFGRQRDRLGDEVDSLRNTILQLQADSEYAKMKLCGVDSEIEAKREHLNDLKSQREKIRREILELEEQSALSRDAFESTRSEYEANQRQFQRDQQSIERRIEKLSDEATRLQETCGNLEQDRSDLQSELQSLKTEFDRNIEIQTLSLAEVTRSLQDANIEKALVDEAIETSQANLRQIVATHKDLQTQIESLQSSKVQLSNCIAGLNEEVSQKRELNDLLESQTKVLIEDRELRCTKLDKSIAELDGNLSTRRGELLQATHEFESVQNHHRQLAADVDHLNRVKAAMETSVSELTDRLANKSTDFKRKSVQVNELASKIDSLSLSVRSLATQESGTKATNGTGISGVGSLGSDVSATSLSGEENGQRSTKPSLQGPHWGQENLHRMIDRMDEIDRLAEDGLA